MSQRLPLLAGVVALIGVTAGIVVGAHDALMPRGAGELTPSTHFPEMKESEGASESFPLPSGNASALSCEAARSIVTQIHATLAYEPHSVVPSALASSAADWLDPYGIWTASPDSPIAGLLGGEGANLLRELEDRDPASCHAAHSVAAALLEWTHKLAARFDESRARARSEAPRGAGVLTAAAEESLLDDSRPALDVAATLGVRVGQLERGLGPTLTTFGDLARARFFPSLSEEGWASVVRAAAVRAYLPLIDPHGAWAPAGEESSVYDVDLDPRPPESLWGDGVRTAIGVLVANDPLQPLQLGDVVLALGGVATVGLPPEQLTQLVYATTDALSPQPILILRHGEHSLRTLLLPPPEDESDSDEPAPTDLPSYRVAYGEGDAMVVEIHDVRSDLGEQLAAVLRRERATDRRHLAGILLDLRGNGGGAADGALDALGLFLPGAPLFPMLHHDGTIEVDHAPESLPEDRWVGPVAALVDRDTASAAEMIAGGLLAYGRGPVIGERTFGKGCAQEYVDDAAGAGVLRLTTLLYSLPDGTAVQRVGLAPSLLLPMEGSGPREREADEPNAPPSWTGPDIRDPDLSSDAHPWPSAHGKVGRAPDSTVVAALRQLGAIDIR